MDLLKIRDLSHKKNITLKDVATACNMTYQNLNRCINENKIQAQDLEKIAQALSVPVSYFFDEECEGMSNHHTNNGGQSISFQAKKIIQDSEAGYKAAQSAMQQRIADLEKLVAAKDGEINTLKEMIALLRR